METVSKSLHRLIASFFAGILIFGIGVNGVLRSGDSEVRDIFVFLIVIGFGFAASSARRIQVIDAAMRRAQRLDNLAGMRGSHLAQPAALDD